MATRMLPASIRSSARSSGRLSISEGPVAAAVASASPRAVPAARVNSRQLIAARSLSTVSLSSLARSSASSARISPICRAPVRTYATEGSTPPSSQKVEPVAKTPEPSLSRTPLYNLHIEHGAKMVPFAGYEMPLTYAWGGQLAEHHQVRKQAGIFDVSHMVQSVVSGDGATAFIERLVPVSTEGLRHPAQGKTFGDSADGPYLGSLSVLLNEQGGIIDDLIVTRQGEETYYLVTNAGRRKEDLAHITSTLDAFNKDSGKSVKHDVLEGRGLIALQGPKASSVLQPHVEADLSQLYFGESVFTTLGPSQVRVHIARGGYTGEDGFEISIPESESIALTKLLLDGGAAQLVGLAARDSLRLEAGMCLYGHDLSEDVGPVEAGLTWVVGADRQTGDASSSSSSSSSFIGAERTLAAMKAKTPKQRRVGLLVESGPVAREGTPIFAPGESEKQIGRITSGIPSPTLKQNIAMAYVDTGKHKLGTELEVKLRGKMRKAQVVRMTFVPNNYYRRPKNA